MKALSRRIKKLESASAQQLPDTMFLIAMEQPDGTFLANGTIWNDWTAIEAAYPVAFKVCVQVRDCRINSDNEIP